MSIASSKLSDVFTVRVGKYFMKCLFLYQTDAHCYQKQYYRNILINTTGLILILQAVCAFPCSYT